jgi:hypothetical protein
MNSNIVWMRGEWYYRDETSGLVGPYGRREEAEDALRDHADWLNDGPNDKHWLRITVLLWTIIIALFVWSLVVS